MPRSVSKRQFRFMNAILHGKVKDHPRGVPPKSVAAKYSSPDKDAPEQSGEDRGGNWNEEHHKRAKDKVKQAREDRKKKKKTLKKAFDDFYKGSGAGVIVTDKDGKILIGKQNDGKWATPGGHVEEGEDFRDAALRELREETGLVGKSPDEICRGKFEGNESVTYHVSSYRGSIKGDGELKNLKFVDTVDVPFDNMRSCSLEGIRSFLQARLSKARSIGDLLAMERLEKNILRGPTQTGAVYDISHTNSLSLVGNSAFRFIRDIVKDMKDEDFKDASIGNYKLSIRKHMNDVYSGRITDGHKMVHQFANRSLPLLTAELMSVFEWYLPEDEPGLDALIDDSILDDALEGGLNELVDNYRKHNIGNIYAEMESIREEIRNDNAVDVQQVEGRMGKLFDRLEDYVLDMASKHNKLAQEAGKEIETLEEKLRQLQTQVDELSTKPKAVEAFTTTAVDKNKILDEHYFYLSRPSIEISPNGKIRIVFNQDWNDLDRENLLKDMKARMVSGRR